MSYQELWRHVEDIRQIADEKDGDPHLIGDVCAALRQYERVPNPAELAETVRGLEYAPRALFAPEPRGNPFFPPGTAPFGYNPVLREMDSVRDHFAGWTGEGAQAFQREVLDVFPIVARNQFVMAAIIVAILDAERALWEQVRINIDQLAERAVAALSIVDEWCHPRREWVIHFTAFEAVTNTIHDRLPAIGLDDRFRSLLSSGLAGLRSDRPGMWISGSTTNAVLASTRGAVDDCTRYLMDIEQQLAHLASYVHSMLQSTSGGFALTHAALADATPGTIRDAMGTAT